jgi:hypothetical protein
MAGVIFSSINCLKKDIYINISNLLLGAGWQNISSKPATDFDVWYSKGNSGTQNLYLNINPNTFATSDSTLNISFYTCTSYTPGAAGVAGTFVRKSTVADLYFRENNTATAQKIVTTTPYILWYNVDKNRIIFIAEPYPGYGLPAVACFWGLPNTVFINETPGTGVLIAQSCRSTLGKCWCQDYSMRTVATTNVQHDTMLTVPPSEKNTQLKRFMTPIYYGNANDGMRGQIEGIYALYNGTETTCRGLVITDQNNNQYRVVTTGTPNATYPYDSSFTSHVIAFQIG